MTYDMIIFTCVSRRTMPLFSRAIGAYTVAHAVRQTGRSVQVIDFTDHFTEDELFETTIKLIGPNTKFLGVSATFYQEEMDNFNFRTIVLNPKQQLPSNVINVVERLKNIFPHIKYLLGGYCQNYEAYPMFDAVFHSYSDQSILEYIENNHRLWPKKFGMEVVEGEQFPIDVEHLSHRWAPNDFVFQNETLPIEISRGCIFKCKFCNYQLTGKKKLDYIRDASILRDELIYNYEKFGTTNYTFADDTFNDSTYKLEQLHKVISDLPFKINFITYLRLDLLYAHREQIQLVKELGLRSAFFGIESFNPPTAKLIGKGLAADKIKDFLLELRHDHFKDDINFVCSFILGLPFESLESMENTFKWNQANDINAIYFALDIRPTIRYKSDLDENYEKHGYTLQSNGQWKSEITTFQDMYKLAMEYNRKTNSTINTWLLLSAASLEFMSIAELQKLRSSTLSKDILTTAQSILQRKMNEYKNKLNRTY